MGGMKEVDRLSRKSAGTALIPDVSLPSWIHHCGAASERAPKTDEPPSLGPQPPICGLAVCHPTGGAEGGQVGGPAAVRPSDRPSGWLVDLERLTAVVLRYEVQTPLI